VIFFLFKHRAELELNGRRVYITKPKDVDWFASFTRQNNIININNNINIINNNNNN